LECLQTVGVSGWCIIIINNNLRLLHCSQAATGTINRTNNKLPRRTAPVQQKANLPHASQAFSIASYSHCIKSCSHW